MKRAAITPPTAARSFWDERSPKASPIRARLMPYRDAPRGRRARSCRRGAFVSFIQNHDQIGNRAFGERLNALAPPEAIRALASVYLLAPQTPMLFMGEEWGAEQPFLFFCDFQGELAEAVREGPARGILALSGIRRPGTEGEDPRSVRGSDLSCVQAGLGAGRFGSSGLLPGAARRAPRPCPPAPAFHPAWRRVHAFWANRRSGSSGGLRTAAFCSTPTCRREKSRRPPSTSRRSGAAARLKRRSAPGASGGRSRGHERSPRHLPAAIARRFRVQRGRGDRALPGAAWRQSCLSAADLQGSAGQRARL